MADAQGTYAEIVERIAAAEGLRAVLVEPLLDSDSRAPIGEVATLEGMNVDKAVGMDLRLDDGRRPLWKRVFHVFSRTSSLIPHLALEWSGSDDAPSEITVLVDLLPRIDLAVNLDYVDEVYGPLTAARDSLLEAADFAVEAVPPRRAIALSPWRISGTFPAEQLTEVAPVVERYTERWLSINSGGVGASVDPLARDQARLIQHDRFHRNALFDPDSDPFWERVDRALGLDGAAALRLTLRSQRER